MVVIFKGVSSVFKVAVCVKVCVIVVKVAVLFVKACNYFLWLQLSFLNFVFFFKVCSSV